MYKAITFEGSKIESVTKDVNKWLEDNPNFEVVSSNMAVRPISVGTYFTVYTLYKEIKVSESRAY